MAAGATYEPIATTTLGSAQSSVTFSSISGSYTDLVLVLAGTSGGNDIRIRLNSDTGNNYSYTRIYGNGSAVYSDRDTNQNNAPATLGGMTDGNSIVYLNNYSNTTTYKTVVARANNNPGGYTGIWFNLWRSTSAITSITALVLAGSISSGSTFTLYGIAAA